MKVNKVKRAIIAAFAAVFAFVAPAVAANVVLPNGIDTSSYQGDKTVYDGTTYYETLQAAVEAVCGTAGATLYCKPGADVGSLQHAPVTATLTIYGNGAYVSGGSERDFDIGNTDPSGGKDITADMTLTVKDLEGCGAWGAKATDYTVNLVFEDCQNMGKVFITGTTGTLNITMTDCAFEGVIKEALYSNADGAITLNNVAFSNLTKAVNLNHKAAGTQTVTLTNCSFTDCGADVSADQIPVRVLSSVKGGKSTLTVSGCTFSGTPEGGADILLPEGAGTTVATVSTTTANVSNKGTMVEVKIEETYTNVAPTQVEVDTLDELLAALADNTNDLPIVITAQIVIPTDVTITLDLNGKTVTSVYQTNSTDKHIYPLNVYGNLTIKDTKVNGSITGRGIFVQVGSKLTVESGSIYAIDSNGGSALWMYGGDVVINGGHIEQKASGTYNFAINATAGTVTVNGGWVGGNHGAIAAGGAAVVINGGELVCTGTAGMTDNVLYTYDTGSITINGGTFVADNDGPAGGCCVYDANGGATINGGTFGNSSGGDVWGTTGTTIKGGTFSNLTETQHIADGFKLDENGQVVAKPVVAKIGENYYATLSAAFAAVTDDSQTVTILTDVTEELTGAYLRGNITTENDAKVTITLTNSDWVYCPYTFVLGANVTLKCPALFYYAGGTQINGTLIVGAYYQRYAGTKLTINEPGSMTVTTEMFYLRYTDGDANAGIYINGDNDDSTIGLNTSVIYFYQGMINAKNANIKASVYWQTNETDGQGSANLVLDNSKLNVTVNEQKVKATGNSTVTLTNGSELIAPGGFEVGGVLKSSCDITGAISKISDQATIEISGGTYTQDVSDWCVDGYAAVKTLDYKYVVSAMPTATISNLGSITVGLGDYKADAYMMYDIINGGKLQEATVPYDLTLAMDFKAKDTAETAAQNAFGNYTTDFFITMSGMSQASFVGDGCYLAGYYPSFKAWVKIPLDGFTVENGKVYPVITSAGFDFKYTDICGTVGQFICGIYLTPEVLAANPNLTVDLTLGLAENKDAALNAEFLKVDNYVYDVDDLVTLPEVVITDIKNTLTDADPDLTFALNFAIKDVDKLSEEYLEKLFAKYGDYYTDYVLTISGLTDPNGSVKFNANGNGDGYLAGQYDAWSTNWVTVPFSDVTVTNGQSFYIMEYAAELMNKGGLRLTLKEIAEIVKNFDCGVYFTPEFLAANPNLKVDLELKVFTEDENGNKVGDISVATNTFDKDDFSVEAAKLDIRIVNGKPQIGFAGEGKLVLNAATALTGEWTKNIEYTLVENDGDDTKTWVTPAEGYYFFKGFITK